MNAFLLARSARWSLPLLLGFVCTVVLLAAANLLPSYAQDPCQEPMRYETWPIFRAGDTILTDFDSALPDHIREQILRGLDSWNNSDARQCSGIEFSGSDPDLIEPNRPEPAYVHYRYAPLYDEEGELNRSTVARFTPNQLREDGTILVATVTFNSAALANPSDPNSGPYYDPNAPILPGATSNGYDTIFQKTTAHEIGHGFRLLDLYFGSERASVMLGAVYDCPNDNCGHKPLNPTSCDSSAVCKVYCPDDDGDGVTTCDGDCDDTDPSMMYECYYVDPYPYYCCQPSCYHFYNCYDRYSCQETDDEFRCSYSRTECYYSDSVCYY